MAPIFHRCLLLFILLPTLGCSEGMLWKTGYLSPWARKQWADEEQIAHSLFYRRQQLNEMVEQSANGQANPDQVAQKLSEIALKDQVVLIRIEAVKALGDVDSPEALHGLQTAIKDPDSDVRLAAVASWRKKQNLPQAVVALHSALASDQDRDVQIAAAKALGSFKGDAAVEALEVALRNSDPALQLSATQSLAAVTGLDYGGDVKQWRNYIANRSPAFNANQGSSPTDSFVNPTRQANFLQTGN